MRLLHNSLMKNKVTLLPLHRAYYEPSFIARTEVDANDVVKPAEGSGVAPGLGRAGLSLAGW